MKMGISIASSHFLPSLPSSHRKSPRRRRPAPMASMGERSSEGAEAGRRRTLLLVGVSVLPFWHLRTVAAGEIRGARRVGLGRRSGVSRREQLRGKSEEKNATERSLAYPEAPGAKQLEETSPQEPSQPEMATKDTLNPELQVLTNPGQEILKQDTSQPEQIPIQNGPGNLFTSLLNELGIICSGILGALYATSRKEKTALESTIESMKAELIEKEAATTFLKENFEASLLSEQEERRKQIRKLKEEETSLSTELASANGTIAGLREELQSAEHLTEDLKARASQLEHAVSQAAENGKTLETKLKEKMDTIDVLHDKISLLSLEINDKEKNIENLKSSLVEKESTNMNLSSITVQTKSDLAEANSTMEKLRDEILKYREDLDSKKSSINSLNDTIKSLHAEKTDTANKLQDLVKEYNDLKSSSQTERALNSELLSKKDGDLHELEERLGLALSEASENKVIIAQLMEDRDHVKAMLEKEVNDAKKIKDDLRIVQEELGASRYEASNLSEELEEAKRSYKMLTSRVSDIQDELHDSKKLLNTEVDKQKSTIKALSDELEANTDILERTKEELSATSNDLKAAIEERESLKKELLEIYKLIETTKQELNEERKLVATLNGELEVLGKQMVTDSAGRKALEADLEEATISLDAMNKSTLLLAKELEESHSRTSSLESEKELLLKSLIEQKKLSKEAQENIEDAHNLITRLGGEKEILEKRSKKLEEELTLAKGEILRTRRKISTAREPVNDVRGGTPFGVKKATSKRRKGVSASEDS